MTDNPSNLTIHEILRRIGMNEKQTPGGTIPRLTAFGIDELLFLSHLPEHGSIAVDINALVETVVIPLAQRGIIWMHSSVKNRDWYSSGTYIIGFRWPDGYQMFESYCYGKEFAAERNQHIAAINAMPISPRAEDEQLKAHTVSKLMRGDFVTGSTELS